MIIDQERLIFMIKISHATRRRVTCKPCQKDPQEKWAKNNLHLKLITMVHLKYILDGVCIFHVFKILFKKSFVAAHLFALGFLHMFDSNCSGIFFFETTMKALHTLGL